MLHYLSGGAWDPHDVNAVAATCESSVQFWDLRAMKYDTSAYLFFKKKKTYPLIIASIPSPELEGCYLFNLCLTLIQMN